MNDQDRAKINREREQIARDITAARESIVSSMTGENTDAQKVIVLWTRTITDEATALAMSEQMINWQADQERADYPWSLHGYAVRCLISMILLPRPADDAPTAVHEAFRQAIMALESEIKGWLRRVDEARAEMEAESAVEAVTAPS